MKCFVRNLLLLFFLLALVGCKVDATNALERAGSLRLTIPSTQSTPAQILTERPPEVGEDKEQLLEPSSPLHKWCQDWLETNADGWEQALASYAPNYVLSGKGFSLNIFETGVVLNFIDKNGQAHQYTKGLNFDDYQRFLKIAGI